MSLYYTNKADEALAQFEHSLKINPKHTKTLLNKGIVLAFGKQDLKAAAAEWEKVVTLAPDSPEGQAARRALEGVAAAHAGGGAAEQPVTRLILVAILLLLIAWAFWRWSTASSRRSAACRAAADARRR